MASIMAAQEVAEAFPTAVDYGVLRGQGEEVLAAFMAAQETARAVPVAVEAEAHLL
jgi:hypothetical protein